MLYKFQRSSAVPWSSSILLNCTGPIVTNTCQTTNDRLWPTCPLTASAALGYTKNLVLRNCKADQNILWVAETATATSHSKVIVLSRQAASYNASMYFRYVCMGACCAELCASTLFACPHPRKVQGAVAVASKCPLNIMAVNQINSCCMRNLAVVCGSA